MNRNNEPNDHQEKTTSKKTCCARLAKLKKHLPTIKIGRSGATAGLVILEDQIRKRTAGPSEKNTGTEKPLPEMPSNNPIGTSPIRAKTSEEQENEPKQHRLPKLVSKDLEKINSLDQDKSKVRGKNKPVENNNSTPQVRNMSITGKSSTDGQKKNLDVHVSDVDVKAPIGNGSAANSSSAVSDVVTTTPHKRDLEQRIAREIDARITRAVSNVVKLDMPESEVQTKVPVKKHQKEPTSNVEFDRCIAAVIGSMLMESKYLTGPLNNKSDKFPEARNNATEMLEDIFKTVSDRLNLDKSTTGETNALGTHHLKRVCKQILTIVLCESYELKDGKMGKHQTSFLNTIMEEENDILDADHKVIGQQEHASPVPSPPATPAKPDSVRGSARRTTRPKTGGNISSERLGILGPHAKKRKVPPVRLDEKQHCPSRGRKPCDFPRSIGIGALPPEATGDLNFLFRPAPGVPPPLPRRFFVGEVGWGVEHGFKLGTKYLHSGHQIKRSGFRLDMEDRLSQILPDPWQAPAHCLDRQTEAECPRGPKCLQEPPPGQQ